MVILSFLHSLPDVSRVHLRQAEFETVALFRGAAGELSQKYNISLGKVRDEITSNVRNLDLGPISILGFLHVVYQIWFNGLDLD